MLARAEAVKHSLALADYEDLTASELDSVAAPWFRAGVEEWGKAEAYASRINVAPSYLSAMMDGNKPVALRHLLPLHEEPCAVRALVSPLCAHAGLEPPQPRRRLTREQVAEEALKMCANFDPLRRSLERDLKERFGASPEDVARVLVGK